MYLKPSPVLRLLMSGVLAVCVLSAAQPGGNASAVDSGSLESPAAAGSASPAPAAPVLRPDGGLGVLDGQVLDRTAGTPVRGVAVVLAGTDVGTLTDNAGRFQLTGVPSGTYTVNFIKGGFLDANVTGVQIDPGGTRRLDFALTPRPTEMSDEVFDLSDVTVTAEQATVLVQSLELRLNADKLLNIFSAEDFSKFAAGDVADAIKRIAGVNIIEGQFAIIRGLEDRYSSTTYNSAPVPSPDPNSQSVQLDLFPSDVVGNLQVAKTFSGDLPGNSSGGSINIITNDYPKEWELKLGAGTGINANADYRFIGLVPGSPIGAASEQIAETDFSVSLGGRSRVASREVRLKVFAGKEVDFDTKVGETERREPKLAITKKFPKPEKVTVSGDLSLGQLSLSGGRFDVTESTRGQQDTVYLGLGLDLDPQGRHRLDASFFYTTKADEAVRMKENGVLPNFDYSTLNPAAVQDGDFTGFATNSAWIARGVRESPGDPPSRGHIWFAPTYESTSVRRERDLLVSQLNGDHTFVAAGGLHLTWAANLASTTQDEEAYGARYFYEPADTAQIPVPPAPATVASLGPGQFASTSDVFFSRNLVEEKQKFARLDADHEKKLTGWLAVKLNAGAYYENATRDVKSQYLESPSVSGLGQFAVLAPTQEALGTAIFSTLDRDPGTGELAGLRKATIHSTREIEAAHFGAKVTLWEKLDLLGSFRVEDMLLESRNDPFFTQPDGRMSMYPNRFVLANVIGLPAGSIGNPFTEGSPFDPANLPFYQNLVAGKIAESLFLPAFGATWRPTTGTSLRVAWSQTTARPSFREMGYYVSVDPGSSELVVGNPQLTLSEVESWDARAERTWGEGDLVAVSVFRKEIARPLESIVVRDPTNFEGSGGLFRTFINNPDTAQLEGIEVEARKSLGFLGGGFARHFTLGGNFTQIDAQVRRTAAELANTASFFGLAAGDTARFTGLAPTRRLFGQPEWIANFDLTFEHSGWGTRATLAWYAISDVLDAAGSATIGPDGRVNAATLDRYVGGYSQVDFVLSQKWGKWTFKFSAKNLGNPARRIFYDSSQTVGSIPESTFRAGRDYAISISRAF